VANSFQILQSNNRIRLIPYLRKVQTLQPVIQQPYKLIRIWGRKPLLLNRQRSW